MNRRLCFLIFSMILSMAFSLNAQKIGYINSQTILAEHPSVKQATANLEALQKQLQKKGQGMLDELRNKYAELQRKEQQGELSPKQLEEEGQLLREEETKIQQFEQEMQSQLAEKQKTLLQPILDTLNMKIADVAKELGYSFIIDDSAGILVYKDESHDVTEIVKKKMADSSSQ